MIINAKILQLMGLPLYASTRLLGDSEMDEAIKRYHLDFLEFEPKHWKVDRSNWEKSNYYDRAWIYYQWYHLTEDPKYLNQANLIAKDYLTKYVIPNRYGLPFHWQMPKGLVGLALMAGHAGAKKALGALADQSVNPWNTEHNFKNLFNPKLSEGREQARVLEALVCAILVDAPSNGVPNIQANGEDWGVPGGNDFRAIAKKLVNRALTSNWQKPNGSRPNFVEGKAGTAGIDKPFMNGLFNQALINYYECVEQDPRIPSFIQKNLDFMWANEWSASKRAFQYIDKRPTGGDPKLTDVAPDLNMLIVTGFGFLYKYYRSIDDDLYKIRGDLIFQGGVAGTWLEGSKHFNQQYAYSLRYLEDTNSDKF